MTRLLKAAAIPLGMLAGSASAAESMQVSPNGSRASIQGSESTFTGRVTVTPLFPASESCNCGGGLVEFTPGARSHWHTHPGGQTLIVTAGSGWVQQEGGPKIAINPGDVITTPPGVKHWHGAAENSAMSHIAVTPVVDGKAVDWLEPVTDDQYR